MWHSRAGLLGITVLVLLLAASCDKQTHVLRSVSVTVNGKTQEVDFDLKVEDVEHAFVTLMPGGEALVGAPMGPTEHIDLRLQDYGITIRGRTLDDIDGVLMIGERSYGSLEPPRVSVLINADGVFVNGDKRGTLDP